MRILNILALSTILVISTISVSNALPTNQPTKLAWDANVDTITTGYKIYWIEQRNKGITDWKVVPITGIATNTWTFPNTFIENTCFMVTATSLEGESKYSTEICRNFFVLPLTPKNVRVE